MEKIKKLLGAFIVGGCFGFTGQLIIMVSGSVLGAESPLIIPITLIAMGIIGALLFVLNVYQKIEAIGGMGATMPFCGLAAGIAGSICSTRRDGAPLGNAIVTGIKIFATFLALVAALSIAIGACFGLMAR